MAYREADKIEALNANRYAVVGFWSHLDDLDELRSKVIIIGVWICIRVALQVDEITDLQVFGFGEHRLSFSVLGEVDPGGRQRAFLPIL